MDAHSHEEEVCRKRPRSVREFAKANQTLCSYKLRVNEEQQIRINLLGVKLFFYVENLNGLMKMIY